jgi:hypothetical protein
MESNLGLRPYDSEDKSTYRLEKIRDARIVKTLRLEVKKSQVC